MPLSTLSSQDLHRQIISPAYENKSQMSVQRGEQLIQYTAQWSQPIVDGYAEFEPDTDNETETGQCVFRAG